jgi:hypothetical protein
MEEGQGEVEDLGGQFLVNMSDMFSLWQLEAALRAGQSFRILGLTDHRIYDEWRVRGPDHVRSFNERFGRLVDLLRRRPMCESLRAVEIIKVRFDPRYWYREGDIDRLFVDVLPALLATLERLNFSECELPAVGLSSVLSRLLGSSARETSLTQLLVQECAVDPQVCAPLVAELIKSNIPIQVLAFSPSPKMDTEVCQLIFNSLTHNTHLQYLEVGVRKFTDGLVLPSFPHSNLHQLQINVGFWNYESKTSLARQLRTNTTLQILRVVFHRNERRVRHHPWVELLESFNYTLLNLAEDSGLEPNQDLPPDIEDATIAKCLRRNARLRDGFRQLEGGIPAALVPLLLEMASGIPAFLYAFLRRGDVSAMAGRLLLAAAARWGGGGGSGKRNRAA